MRIVLPHCEFEAAPPSLAPRPGSLDGKVVGFLDGWGYNHEGSVQIYPLMAEILNELESAFALKGSLWQQKPSISTPVPQEDLRAFVAQVDVVVNGECA